MVFKYKYISERVWFKGGRLEMCKYCEENAFNTLIKSEKTNIFWWGQETGMLPANCIDEVNNDVVFEIRCGQVI